MRFPEAAIATVIVDGKAYGRCHEGRVHSAQARCVLHAGQEKESWS